MALPFWENVNELIKTRQTTQEWVAKQSQIKYQTMRGWVTKNILPRVDEATRLAQALETTVEYLITGEDGPQAKLTAAECLESDPSVFPVPILGQTVAAGHGQEFLESAEVVGTLPFLRRMLRGADPASARALEVRGDSMTGIEIFDGDLVVFVPGSIRGDGIYVLRVNNSLIVKRVEFDEVSRKIRIMSENSRYPDRVESADGQTVEVVGKVYGWVHAHPY